MFIGHWAPAMVAATCPKAPRLGTLFIAAQLVDIAFFAFVPLGIEHMRFTPGTTVMNPMDLYWMPWTHSLLGSIGWALGFALLYGAVTRNRTGALIGGAVVLSHWFLDLIVHTHDLTLFGSPPKLGLGLWNYPAIEMPLELGLTYGALTFFMLRTRAATGTARLALGLLALAMATVQIVNWFGPVDSEVTVSTWGLALFAYLGIAGLAYWVGATRVVAQRG